MRVTGSRPDEPVTRAPAAAAAIAPTRDLAAGHEAEFAALAVILLCLLAIAVLPRWRVVPFDVIWASLAVLCGYRFGQWRAAARDQARVAAETERLSLALDALLENAVRHTVGGDQITMSVLSDEHARFARIVVEDSGEGIGAAVLPHIFDRFTTVAGDGPRGTGLGLALVQAVARGHGGEVYVRSAPGQGSRFELQLPAAPASAATESAIGQEIEPAIGQETR